MSDPSLLVLNNNSYGTAFGMTTVFNLPKHLVMDTVQVFLREKIKNLGSAIFFNQSDAVLKLPTSIVKIINVDEYGYIWFFMQKLNMIEHVVNLKYGLGLELNNYHFDDKSIQFNKNPTLITQTYTGLHKNKLAADYLTAPIMLNFNFTPKRDNNQSFGFSAGVSAGLLYSARQKIKNGRVDKTKDDFDLRTWKLSYVGELTLGPVRLYGSYALKPMFEKGLDMTPYNVGFRFSNW